MLNWWLLVNVQASRVKGAIMGFLLCFVLFNFSLKVFNKIDIENKFESDSNYITIINKKKQARVSAKRKRKKAR